ncbi:MAG: propanediol dehydratase small subunit PduE [Roseiflexaceae bacterium]
MTNHSEPTPPAYPLIDQAAQLQSASGKPLTELNPAALAAGSLTPADLQIDPATLRAQAEVARAAGYPQLATNLLRAAELTAVPNDEILRMYDALRPGRSSHADLIALADRLEQIYHAPICATLVREAAEVYRLRGIR